jgi:hypothetical protein
MDTARQELPTIAVFPANAAAQKLDGAWIITDVTADACTLTFDGTLDPAHGRDTYALLVFFIRHRAGGGQLRTVGAHRSPFTET